MNLSRLHILVLAVCVPLITTAQGKWNKYESKDGLNIWYQSDTAKNLYRIKIEAKTNTDILTIYNRLLDVSAYPRYVSHCEYSELLKKISENHLIYYTITRVPFPLKNRDVVVELISTRTDNEIRMITKSKNDFMQKKEQYERVMDYYASWFLKKEGDKTEAVLIMEIGIPDYAPKWMKEYVIFKGPVETYKNFTGNADL